MRAGRLAEDCNALNCGCFGCFRSGRLSLARLTAGFASAQACRRGDGVLAKAIMSPTALEMWSLYPDGATSWANVQGRAINVVVRAGSHRTSTGAGARRRRRPAPTTGRVHGFALGQQLLPAAAAAY